MFSCNFDISALFSSRWPFSCYKCHHTLTILCIHACVLYFNNYTQTLTLQQWILSLQKCYNYQKRADQIYIQRCISVLLNEDLIFTSILHAILFDKKVLQKGETVS